jgi:hypothetical protein
LDVHIVVGFSPIHPNEYHLAPLARSVQHRARGPQQPTNGSVLEARHPTSRHGNLAVQQGHGLDLASDLRPHARRRGELTPVNLQLGLSSLAAGRPGSY